MTDLRKAAEMALERLESHEYWMDEEAIQSLRQALAQPKWVCCVCGEPEALGIVHSADAPCFHYTKREWVGITKEDKKEILEMTQPDERGYVIAITEAKLKEKNT